MTKRRGSLVIVALIVSIVLWTRHKTEESTEESYDGAVRTITHSSDTIVSEESAPKRSSVVVERVPATAKKFESLWRRFDAKYGPGLEAETVDGRKLARVLGRPGSRSHRSASGFRLNDGRTILALGAEILRDGKEMIWGYSGAEFLTPIVETRGTFATVTWRQVVAGVPLHPAAYIEMQFGEYGELLSLHSSLRQLPTIENEPKLSKDQAAARVRSISPSSGEAQGGDLVLWIDALRSSKNQTTLAYAYGFYQGTEEVLVDAATGAELLRRKRSVE